MTATTDRTYRSDLQAGRDGFPQLLYAEWTKFVTVRGWMIGMIIAVLATVGIALLNHGGCGGQRTPNGPVITGLNCAAPIGPGGQAVTDSFYFVHRPLASNGSITAEVTSFLARAAGQENSSLQPWSKTGIIIEASTRPGAAYAAIMVTRSHGVRMQYDYTGDIAGSAGPVSAKSPRWLRLIRSGDTITGYESADGAHWRLVGRTRLAGLPATVPAGFFTATPASSHLTSQSITGSSATSGATLATAVFDHVAFAGGQSAGAWTGTNVGGSGQGGRRQLGGSAVPGFRQAGGSLIVSGSGDIAPDVPAAGGNGALIEENLIGVFAALIAVIVVATMFMTAEYRRGLLRVTLVASPRRGRVLAAKAIVIGSVAFVAGLVGSIAALVFGERLLRSGGIFILPVSTLTQVRVVAGTAALVAVAAVLALAIGALLRSSAAAVTTAIGVIVVPWFFSNALAVLPVGAADWLLRITPAAGFAIQQSVPRYEQVTASYTPINGYYPLAPWAGFAVLCGYTAIAFGLAVIALRRTDA